MKLEEVKRMNQRPEIVKRSIGDIRFTAWGILLAIAGGSLLMCSCRHHRLEAPSNPFAAAGPNPTMTASGGQLPPPNSAASDQRPLPPHVMAQTAQMEGASVDSSTVHRADSNHPGTRQVQPVGFFNPVPPNEIAGRPPVDAMTPGAPNVMDPCPPVGSNVYSRDEYICDGGDSVGKAYVRSDWSVEGLDQEDTIAHFDTLEGRTKVEESNRVCIYSPRFATVRKIEGVLQSGQETHVASVDRKLLAVTEQKEHSVGMTAQQSQADFARNRKLANAYRSRQQGGALVNPQGLVQHKTNRWARSVRDLMTLSHLGDAELAYLAQDAEAARAWESAEGVKVILNNNSAMAVKRLQKAATVFVIGDPETSPELRLVKIASTSAAQPGEIVEFTLRFDNIGNEVIGNVTLIDELTTRLEYVEGSATCSLEGNFVAEANPVGSRTLRWEITDPMKAGEHGVIRFRCRVR